MEIEALLLDVFAHKDRVVAQLWDQINGFGQNLAANFAAEGRDLPPWLWGAVSGPASWGLPQAPLVHGGMNPLSSFETPSIRNSDLIFYMPLLRPELTLRSTFLMKSYPPTSFMSGKDQNVEHSGHNSASSTPMVAEVPLTGPEEILLGNFRQSCPTLGNLDQYVSNRKKSGEPVREDSNLVKCALYAENGHEIKLPSSVNDQQIEEPVESEGKDDKNTDGMYQHADQNSNLEIVRGKLSSKLGSTIMNDQLPVADMSSVELVDFDHKKSSGSLSSKINEINANSDNIATSDVGSLKRSDPQRVRMPRMSQIDNAAPVGKYSLRSSTSSSDYSRMDMDTDARVLCTGSLPEDFPVASFFPLSNSNEPLEKEVVKNSDEAYQGIDQSSNLQIVSGKLSPRIGSTIKNNHMTEADVSTVKLMDFDHGRGSGSLSLKIYEKHANTENVAVSALGSLNRTAPQSVRTPRMSRIQNIAPVGKYFLRSPASNRIGEASNSDNSRMKIETDARVHYNGSLEDVPMESLFTSTNSRKLLANGKKISGSPSSENHEVDSNADATYVSMRLSRGNRRSENTAEISSLDTFADEDESYLRISATNYKNGMPSGSNSSKMDDRVCSSRNVPQDMHVESMVPLTSPFSENLASPTFIRNNPQRDGLLNSPLVYDSVHEGKYFLRSSATQNKKGLTSRSHNSKMIAETDARVCSDGSLPRSVYRESLAPSKLLAETSTIEVISQSKSQKKRSSNTCQSLHKVTESKYFLRSSIASDKNPATSIYDSSNMNSPEKGCIHVDAQELASDSARDAAELRSAVHVSEISERFDVVLCNILKQSEHLTRSTDGNSENCNPILSHSERDDMLSEIQKTTTSKTVVNQNECCPPKIIISGDAEIQTPASNSRYFLRSSGANAPKVSTMLPHKSCNVKLSKFRTAIPDKVDMTWPKTKRPRRGNQLNDVFACSSRQTLAPFSNTFKHGRKISSDFTSKPLPECHILSIPSEVNCEKFNAPTGSPSVPLKEFNALEIPHMEENEPGGMTTVTGTIQDTKKSHPEGNAADLLQSDDIRHGNSSGVLEGKMNHEKLDMVSGLSPNCLEDVDISVQLPGMTEITGVVPKLQNTHSSDIGASFSCSYTLENDASGSFGFVKDLLTESGTVNAVKVSSNCPARSLLPEMVAHNASLEMLPEFEIVNFEATSEGEDYCVTRSSCFPSSTIHASVVRELSRSTGLLPKDESWVASNFCNSSLDGLNCTNLANTLKNNIAEAKLLEAGKSNMLVDCCQSESRDGSPTGTSNLQHFAFKHNLQRPCTPQVDKYCHNSNPGRSGSSSRMVLNPELVCFSIEGNVSTVEKESFINELDETVQEKVPPHNRKPLADLTSLHQNVPCSIDHKSQECLDSERLDSISTKDCMELSVNEGQSARNVYGNYKKSNVKIKKSHRSLASRNKTFKEKSLRTGSSKPKTSLEARDRSRSVASARKGHKPSNIVTNVSSFIPLIQKKIQAAAQGNGKREIKVKALEAAEAAKRLEEKKEKERQAKKEASRLERIKLEQEKMKNLEIEQKRKEEEKKKKEAQNEARKRRREEQLKEKNDKRKCTEEAKRLRKEPGTVHVTEKELEQNAAMDRSSVMDEVQKGKLNKKENQESLSYTISPYHDSEGEDEEDNRKRKWKFIPSWVRRESLEPILNFQRHLQPMTIFCRKKSFNITEVLLARGRPRPLPRG